MIKIDLEDWEEDDLKGRIVERISNTIISREFKLYGDIPDEGYYTHTISLKIMLQIWWLIEFLNIWLIILK